MVCIAWAHLVEHNGMERTSGSSCLKQHKSHSNIAAPPALMFSLSVDVEVANGRRIDREHGRVGKVRCKGRRSSEADSDKRPQN